MGFTVLNPILPRQHSSGGIRAELRKGRNQKFASLLISFSGPVRQEIGIVGDDVELAVMLGEAEDHGLLRMRRAESGDAVTLTAHRIPIRASGGEYHRVKCGHVPILVNASRPPLPCKWEKLDNGWLEIVLPAWADETAPKRGAISATDPKALRAKAAAEADKARQEAERKEAEQRRRRREALGDELASQMERAAR